MCAGKVIIETDRIHCYLQLQQRLINASGSSELHTAN